MGSQLLALSCNIEEWPGTVHFLLKKDADAKKRECGEKANQKIYRLRVRRNYPLGTAGKLFLSLAWELSFPMV